MKKDILFPLRRLHGNMYEVGIIYKRKKLMKRYLGKKNSRKVIVFGTPSHINIGDSAIVLAERIFLRECGYSECEIKELTVGEVSKDLEFIIKYIHSMHNSIVVWHGGGNMGDQWVDEELFRRRVMDNLSNKPMIVFPQTIHYSDTETGRIEATKSIPYYTGRKELTIVAREKKSFDIMRTMYSDTDILLTPDIVLSTTMNDYGVVPEKRNGVLFCIRTDIEKSVDNSVWCILKNVAAQMGKCVRETDMYADSQVTKENRRDCICKKMQEFCGSELVITDRLHGMVFAAITGTPCVVFSNYNHKVKGTYDWISYLSYIRYVDNLEQAKAAIPELLEMRECQFDNLPLKPYFDKLAEVVKEKCLK